MEQNVKILSTICAKIFKFEHKLTQSENMSKCEYEKQSQYFV